jgi:signal transduction histidine kinase
VSATRAASRRVQVAIGGLLVLCLAQAVYWIVDQATYTQEVDRRILERYAEQARGADLLLRHGVAWEAVAEVFPRLVPGGDGGAVLDPEHTDELDRARHHRINRYGWEGSFFLLVLLCGLGVIDASLRQRAELSRRQHNFLAAVSHEFKSPLASLRLAAETLALRKPAGEALAALSGRMVEDLTRLDATVGNILDAGEIEEGRLVLAPQDVALAGVVSDVLAESATRAQACDVDLVDEVPGGLRLRADPAALHAVLANLVHNATDAAAAAGGGSVRLCATPDGRRVRVEVRDDGVGFDPREAERLFEKFYRPGDELRRAKRGSGLGLFLVKHFVEQSGGRVQATSDGPGRGALFRFWWPASPGDGGETA